MGDQALLQAFCALDLVWRSVNGGRRPLLLGGSALSRAKEMAARHRGVMMKAKRVLFLPLMLFLALAAIFIVQIMRNAHGDNSDSLASALIGKPAPAFDLPSLTDSTRRYGPSALRDGKPLLLNVWATWCPACRAEHAFLTSLAAQGVRVVGIDYQDDRRKAINWLTVLVYGAPETFLIDGQGIIRYRHAGALDAGVWQRELQPLFEKYRKGA
jgi:cytochrome c biogenesis protein CcmG/thiol:disulfide interchange protein DsbE